MSKEHSYAYEAGYRDGAINYELDHCPACKNVADLQEALEENAKLRELGKQYELVIVDYRAEVAKLREFASEAFSMAFNFYHGAGTAEDLRELKVEYRELGIEVDE